MTRTDGNRHVSANEPGYGRIATDDAYGTGEAHTRGGASLDQSSRDELDSGYRIGGQWDALRRGYGVVTLATDGDDG